jgi:hypothetical protein
MLLKLLHPISLKHKVLARVVGLLRRGPESPLSTAGIVTILDEPEKPTGPDR